MLAEADEPKATTTAAATEETAAQPKEEDPNAPPQPKKKAKTKIGNKSKKKKKLKTTSKFPDGAEGEQEHQDYCEVRCTENLFTFTCLTLFILTVH